MQNPFEKEYPKATGVYIMRDGSKKVLYIGKAKNIKVRLNQYYKSHDNRMMVPSLVKKVAFIETILVDTEKEALLLENTLIKKHRPPYNVLLKDDKTFFSLKLNTKHQWPSLKLVRLKGKTPSDGKYFGPYAHGGAAKKTLEILRELFPLRRCSNRELMNRSRPCLLYQMKKCVGPCVDKCSKEEYDDLVKQVQRFLSGDRESILKELQRDIQEASDAFAFEKASFLVKRLKAIQSTLEGQKVQSLQGGDFDLFGLYRDGLNLTVCSFIYTNGSLTGSKQYRFRNVMESDVEVLERLLLQIYDGGVTPLPPEILLPFSLKRKGMIQQVLESLYQKKVLLKVPQKGEKKKFIDLAQKNAMISSQSDQGTLDHTLTALKELLYLENYPEHIECTDNSHIAGAELVSAFVGFVSGVKDTSHYRKYQLKGIKGGDDYGALKAVLERRCQRMKKDQEFPDLIIIDGGKGHLSVAEKVFSDQQITAVDVIAVAKEGSRHDKGLTKEAIYTSRGKVDLKHDSSEMRLLQRIRDEAHRFVIQYHRKKRMHRISESPIDAIPGVGDQKKKNLLRYFGSLKEVKNASKDELMKVEGISEKLADVIWSYLQDL